MLARRRNLHVLVCFLVILIERGQRRCVPRPPLLGGRLVPYLLHLVLRRRVLVVRRPPLVLRDWAGVIRVRCRFPWSWLQGRLLRWNACAMVRLVLVEIAIALIWLSLARRFAS